MFFALMMIILYGREKNMIERDSTWFKYKDKWSTILRRYHKGGILYRERITLALKWAPCLSPKFLKSAFKNDIYFSLLLQVLAWPSHIWFYLWNLNLAGRSCLCECNLCPLLTAHIHMPEKYMFKGAWPISLSLKQSGMTASAPMSHVKCRSFCIPQSAINSSCMTASSAIHIFLCLILFPNSLQLLILKTVH